MNDINPNYPDYIEKEFEFNITAGQSPERIDVFLTNNIRNASRTKVQLAIDNGLVEINGRKARSNKKVQPGDKIICKLLKPPPIELIPENIPLDVVFEDEHLMVVNKPPGMVVHPAFGNRYGTLVNAVLYHVGIRDTIPIEINDEDDDYEQNVFYESDALRPGIVHRLDKDTSGLIVVSKNPIVHAKLAEQFANRTIIRYYNALIWGTLEESHGIIESQIGRSSKDRKLFAVVKKDGKYSKTEYWKIEEFENVDLLKIKLWTGRTHQIRVHFSNDKHPVVGDISYGGDKVVYGNHNTEFRKKSTQILKIATRQMLHAKVIGFKHPVTSDDIFLESDLPNDIKEVINILK
jgi:23S rRNA pseudouridine1911/1915/1917 synthase